VEVKKEVLETGSRVLVSYGAISGSPQIYKHTSKNNIYAKIYFNFKLEKVVDGINL